MPVRPGSLLPMRSTTLLVLTLFCLLLSSCVTSFYPLAQSDKDLVYRQELIGSWKENDGETYIKVEPGEDRSYAITLVDVNSHDSVTTRDTAFFMGRLVQVEKYLLLDCLVNLDRQADYKRLGEYTRAGLAPTHFIFHITLRDNNKVIELGQLERKEFEKALSKKYAGTRYKKDDESLVLAEPSANLAKLLVKLLKDDPRVWEKSTWTKM